MDYQQNRKAFLENLSDEVMNGFMEDKQMWLDFVNFSVYVHKYSFDEQVLLYRQNPEVRLVATYDEWKSLKRQVVRGSKAIPILDHQTGRFKQVFDVAETVGQDLAIFDWSLTDQDQQSLKDYFLKKDSALNGDHGIKEVMEQVLHEKIKHQVSQGILNSDQVKEVMACAQYITYKRMGISSEGDEKQLNQAFSSNLSKEEFYQVAYLTNVISKQVLVEVEKTLGNVYKKERVSYHERLENENYVQRGSRRNALSRDVSERGEGRRNVSTTGENRVDDSKEFGKGSTRRSHENENEGVVLPLRQEERNRDTGENRESISTTPREESGTEGRPTSRESSTLQHTPETSGGNDSERVELQLNEEQPKSDGTTLSDFFASSSVSLNAFDEFLRTGSNEKNSVSRICSYFKKDHELSKNAQFLKKEYGTGGKGLEMDGKKTSIWFSEEGITLANGKRALNTYSNLTVTWEQTAKRVHELLQDGDYLSQAELDEVDELELNKLGAVLWDLYRGIPSEYEREGRYSFAEGAVEFTKRLSNKEGLTKAIEKLKKDIDENLFTSRWQNPHDILSRLSDLQREPLSFTANEPFQLNHDLFITEDEIDDLLIRGSGFSEGKFRIYSFFLHDHTNKEKASFLKNEYGIGGGSRPNGFMDYNSKGIEFRRGSIVTPYEQVKLSWNQVANRMDTLISDERYMSDKELDYLPDYEKKNLAKDIYLFYYKQPLELKRPYPAGSDYEAAQKLLYEQLIDEDKLDILISEMDMVFEDLNQKHELYERWSQTYQNVIDFQKGNYTLFPKPTFLGTQVSFDDLTTMVDSNQPKESKPIENFQQMSLLPTDEEIEEIEVEEENQKVLPLNREFIPDVLRYDRMMNVKKSEIIAYFKDESSPKERANYLKKAYNKDYSIFDLGNQKKRMGYHAEESGLYVWEGEYLTRPSGSLYPWEELEEIVTGLIQKEAYLEKPELEIEIVPEDDGHTIEPEEGAVTLHNYYREQENPYPKGAKLKYQANVAAITLLKQLELEDRNPTTEDQEVLAKYSGWGGLAETFNSKNPRWHREYQELKDLLTPDEYQNAFESVLSAYYTEPKLVKEIYQMVEHLGFDEGKILDPAMGTGNFFSMLPENLRNSQLYGIELDSITGRISKQLYPQAKVAVKGYEEVDFNDNSFDLVIGNIPFNDIKVRDERYKNQPFLIHDYFMAKSIDVVKENGVVAFITSKGTLDKKDDRVRQYLAKRADLVGAIRLPNNAFMELGGTKATTDILIFQKREKERDLSIDLPIWVKTTSFEESRAPINQYFIENPDHVLGTLKLSGMYDGQSILECVPKEGQNIYHEIEQLRSKFQLNVPISNFSKPMVEKKLEKKMGLIWEERQAVPRTVRNNTYFVYEDRVYFNNKGKGEQVHVSQNAEERLKAMCSVRESLMDVINIQLNENYSKSEFENNLKSLNKSYDDFVRQYGTFNSKINGREFFADDQLALLKSIEVKGKDESISKGKIFFEPTIRPKEKVSHVETAQEALELSLSRKLKVDLNYMEEVSPFSKDQLLQELDGHIYQDPDLVVYNESEIAEMNQYTGWVYRDEYLSGDIQDKLEKASKAALFNSKKYSKNMDALEKALPEPLKPSEIQFQLGSTWIPPEYYEDFMYESFSTPNYYRFGKNQVIKLEFSSLNNTWHISGKSLDKGSVKASSAYGTKRMSAYEILENTLNLQQVTVKDRKVEYKDGKDQVRYVLNPEETMIARGKQAQIKQAFDSWLFKDHTRAQTLVNIYNENFNRNVPRTYDGSHLQFDNMSWQWELRQHQKDVVARIVYNGSALMAHEVGSGKTASMVAAGMYMKQAGTVQKPLYVVPSHLTEQFANEFLSMYPSANILTTTKKDFEKKNRHQFVSKIATNQYDAVIIGHSQFEKIPLSQERQTEFLRTQIQEVTIAMQEAKEEDGNSWTVKQMAGFQKKLQEQLSKMVNAKKKDDILDFEQLGIDFMFVDEAHAYKNLYTFTKLKNVAGVNTSQSQRALDMYQKCLYIQEQNKGQGVVFATGTPISNSMSEMYTMQRYLQGEQLARMGLNNFDNWASTFGEVTSSLEMTPEGSGYRMKNRFAQFHNLPELMNTFQLVADIQTHEMLNLPTPDLHEGKAQIIVSECSDYQKELMIEFAERSELIRSGSVQPHEDNMLKITSEAKLMAIDSRLINPDAHVNENSKIFQCVDKVHDIWEETAEKKSTQIIFSDSGTPKKDQFNVYDEIKDQLMTKGIPEGEIAFIHDAKNDRQREELFDNVRNGRVRILLGSTSKLGTGTNVQNKLVAGHHIDCPWRPSDLTQRDGRVIRQGNENETVFMYRYVTKGTFDGYLWQIQEQKLKYISQVMSGKSISRSCNDMDETVLSAAEVKAIATDNPLLAEKMSIDNDVARLQLLKNSWENERINLKNKIDKQYPQKIEQLKLSVSMTQKEIEHLEKHPLKKDENAKDVFSIVLNGQTYTNRAEAFEVLTQLMQHKNFKNDEGVPIGTYRGFNLIGKYNVMQGRTISINHVIDGKRQKRTIDYMDSSGIGNFSRIQNRLEGLPKDLEMRELELENVNNELEMANKEILTPFKHGKELSDLVIKQSEINARIELETLSSQVEYHDKEDDLESMVAEEKEEEFVVGDKPVKKEKRLKRIKNKDCELER